MARARQRPSNEHVVAYDYRARESSSIGADTVLDRIFSAVELLDRFPEAGRRGRISGTRELVIVPTPFLVAYRVRREKIEMLSLLHRARKWPDNI